MDRELICRLKSVKRVMTMQTRSYSCFECQNRHVRFRYRQFLTNSQSGHVNSLDLHGPADIDVVPRWTSQSRSFTMSAFWRQLSYVIDRGGGQGNEIECITTNLPITGTEVNTPPCWTRRYEFAGFGAVFTTDIDAYAERHTRHSRPPAAAARAPFAATDCAVRGAISARW